MTKKKRAQVLPFYYFSSASDRTTRRMAVSALEDDSLNQFFWGLYDKYVIAGQIDFPTPSVLPTFDLYAYSEQFVEDMPWFTQGELVSGRLKDLLARLAPNQFFACDTRLICRGSVWMDRGKYFLIFATNIIKCHDESRTTWRRGIKYHLADKFFLDLPTFEWVRKCRRPLSLVRDGLVIRSPTPQPAENSTELFCVA